jgi:hypothetical protein
MVTARHAALTYAQCHGFLPSDSYGPSFEDARIVPDEDTVDTFR